MTYQSVVIDHPSFDQPSSTTSNLNTSPKPSAWVRLAGFAKHPPGKDFPMRTAVATLPLSPPTCQEIEQTIGAAVAAVCGAVSQGLLDLQADGKMRAGTRARGGRALAELYALQQANLFLDFEAAAREFGRKALCDYLATLPDPGPCEVRIDTLIGWGA
jgi:hypothetical protein